MKRWIALLSALMLALAAVPALADDLLLDKFYQQAFKESAYRGTVSFSVSGEGTKAIPDDLWQALSALAPQASMTLEHATTRNKEEGQATAALIISGLSDIQLSYLYDDQLIGVVSDLLTPGVTYTASRNWDWSQLLLSSARDENGWPPVWRLVMAVLNAPESWKARAAGRLAEYEAKLSVWVNGYAAVSTGQENGTAYSELSSSIPAWAMKAEARQLLQELYQDEAALSLLREVVSPREAEAYLQPSRMDSVLALVDQLAMGGNLELTRRHDASGAPLLDRMSFPFAQNALFSQLDISVYPVDGGFQWRFEGAGKNGLEFFFTCLISPEGAYEGDVYVRPFTQAQPISFAYSLAWNPGEESYSLADDRSTQHLQGSMRMKPGEGMDWPDQQVTVEAELYSGSLKQASTHLNGSLTWKDLESGASITAQLTSRTVAPFDYTTPSAVQDAVRVDQMTASGRQALVQSWLGQLTKLLSGAEAE